VCIRIVWVSSVLCLVCVCVAGHAATSSTTWLRSSTWRTAASSVGSGATNRVESRCSCLRATLRRYRPACSSNQCPTVSVKLKPPIFPTSLVFLSLYSLLFVRVFALFFFCCTFFVSVFKFICIVRSVLIVPLSFRLHVFMVN